MFHIFDSTEPVTLLEYFVEVEVNVNDLKAIDEPKNLLKNLSLPFALSSMINITDINITTGKKYLSS